MNFEKLTIQSLLKKYETKEAKPSEVFASFFARIKKLNPKLNAYLEFRENETLIAAKKLDDKMGDVSRQKLFGIPLSIKDNFLVEGFQATAGSKILEKYRSPYTATCVENLFREGGLCVGKTNCDEFAMGSSNENSAFGKVANPWDFERVPGGSSGGSASAVASDTCLGALGTDTGGSIRQPASLCGIVGMKPTYGRISRYGVIAYSSSLDQVGPFAKTVWDTARLLEVLSGFDARDATSSASKVPAYSEMLSQSTLKGKIFGVPKALLEGSAPAVKKSFEEAVKAVADAGATVVDVELPHAKYSLATYYLIAPSEASSNLARYDGVHYGHRSSQFSNLEELYSKSRGEGFGAEVKLRIMLGAYALSSGYYDAYYLKASQVRKLISNDFEKAFTKVDAILTPTSPTTAFKFGEKTNDPVTMYLSDIFTIPVNLAGLPGISVPCGLDEKNLPVGLQFIGKPFQEAELLKLAHSYENIRGEFSLPSLTGVI